MEILVSLVAFFAAFAWAESEVNYEQSALSAVQDLNTVSACTERVWPGLSWSNHSFLVQKPGRSWQFAIDVDSRKKFVVDEGTLGAPSSDFAFFKALDREWISINLSVNQYAKFEKSDRYVFEFVAHEAFHKIGQVNWVYPTGARGQQIPVRWEPRFYRAMLEKNLRMAFISTTERKSALKKARYWHDRWKNEYPAEYQSTTDGYEGTARYAEEIASVLARKGCAATELQIHFWLTSNLKSKADLMSSKGQLELDLEGYSIGSLAAHLLRWMYPHSNWEDRVKKGSTPVDILLADVAPQDEATSNEIENEFRVASEGKQDDINKKLGNVPSLLVQPETVLIHLPYKWKGSGSTGYRGFYVDQAGHQFSVFADDIHLSVDGSTFESEPGIVSVDFSKPSSSCSDFGWLIPVAASQVSSEPTGYYRINGDKIKGVVRGKFIEIDKRQVLCMGET